jgi:hypothetical protein
MPYKLTTLVDEHLNLLTSWGIVTVNDLQAFDQEALAFTRASSKPLVHSIFDYTHIEALPSLKDLAAVRVGKEPNVGWTVFTGVKNKVLRMLLSLTVQLVGQRVRFFETNREALEFLAGMDETLPDLSHFDLDAISREAVQEKNSTIAVDKSTG